MKTAIKRLGSYSLLDNEGYIINPSQLEANPPHWLDALEFVKKAYLAQWQESLHSIYVRGSLAKGSAIDHVSDIDSFTVLKPGIDEVASYDELKTWLEATENSLQTQFDFVTGLEAGLEKFQGIHDRENPYVYILKTQSACIYGENLIDQLEPYKLGHGVAFQTKYIHFHLEAFLEAYPKEDANEQSSWLTWLMRRFLRLGMEFVMEAEGRYTRDLYLCYESFAKHYPDQAQRMHRALDLAINPQADAESFMFVTEFGDWLVEEANRKLHSWGYTQDAERQWVKA